MHTHYLLYIYIYIYNIYICVCVCAMCVCTYIIIYIIYCVYRVYIYNYIMRWGHDLSPTPKPVATVATSEFHLEPHRKWTVASPCPIISDVKMFSIRRQSLSHEWSPCGMSLAGKEVALEPESWHFGNLRWTNLETQKCHGLRTFCLSNPTLPASSALYYQHASHHTSSIIWTNLDKL